MVTESRLKTLERFNREGIIRPEEIKELVDSNRTLQQALKQIASYEWESNMYLINVKVPYEMRKIARNYIQGGSSNAVGS